jgi:hypothetical protein
MLVIDPATAVTRIGKFEVLGSSCIAERCPSATTGQMVRSLTAKVQYVLFRFPVLRHDKSGLVAFKRISRVRCVEHLSSDGTFCKRQRSRIFSPTEAEWVVAVIAYLHFVADPLESVVDNGGIAGNLCCAGVPPRRVKKLVTQATDKPCRLIRQVELNR